MIEFLLAIFFGITWVALIMDYVFYYSNSKSYFTWGYRYFSRMVNLGADELEDEFDFVLKQADRVYFVRRALLSSLRGWAEHRTDGLWVVFVIPIWEISLFLLLILWSLILCSGNVLFACALIGFASIIPIRFVLPTYFIMKRFYRRI